MPLKLSHNDPRGWLAPLNKWADWVETQLKGSTSEVAYTRNTANVALATANSITPVTDGLTHGRTPWETDPSYSTRKDDFQFNGAGNIAGYWGETAWLLVGSGLTTYLIPAGPPHAGNLVAQISSTASNTGGAFIPNAFANSNGQQTNQSLMPILDEPGWQATWIFQWTRPFGGSVISSTAFSMAHQSFYIGFGSSYMQTGTIQAYRPPMFMGLRYDTDAGFSMNIQSIAAASGGTTVYTVTSTTLAGSNGLLGNSITVAGATNPANNGTFVCVASSTTTLTLANNAGVLQSGAVGTASTQSIGDSTFMFEYVTNPYVQATSRNNTQGQTFNTTVTPTEGVWYRFDITSTASGTVKMTLNGNGATQATWSFTPTTVVWGDTANAGTCSAGNGGVVMGADSTYTATNKNVIFNPFGFGSQVTLGGTLPTGLTVGEVISSLGSDSTMTVLEFFKTGVTASNTAFTMTGYPGMYPICSLFSDTAGGTAVAARSLMWDYMSFIWNPGLASQAVNTSYSRFFSGT